jgi:thioredoxin reductase
MSYVEDFEVIIVGGSYSGLSAALALARMSRHVLIIDDGKPCNRSASESHNFLPHDGDQKELIYNNALNNVLKYPTVQLVQDHAESGLQVENGFVIGMQSGKTYSAKKIILATGISDILPDIEGFKACWGTSILHCPYCHGYEFSNKKTAILGNGSRAFNMANVVLNLTRDITILTNGEAEFSDKQLSTLAKNKVQIVDAVIEKIIYDHNTVKGISFKHIDQLEFEAMYALVDFKQRSGLLTHFSLDYTDKGLIEIDHYQRTSIQGMYACGDNSSAMRSISQAVYTGNLAGAIVNAKLTEEDFI